VAPALVGSFNRVWRYYQAGIVNTLFGYGLYALFVAVGFNMYLAQITAHIMGVIFNYFTYSRHTFHDLSGSKLRFGLSYLGNYLIGLACLATVSIAVRSPYLAGSISVFIVSVINFFVLKHLVFTEPVRR
jgi:putative flippase GtrA